LGCGESKEEEGKLKDEDEGESEERIIEGVVEEGLVFIKGSRTSMSSPLNGSDSTCSCDVPL